MNDRVDQGSLELEVSNFGPIVDAKIDLRPLTVFIGPSNTGKSYLAILIYALHRYFSGGRWAGRRRFPVDFRMFRRDGNEKLPRKTINAIVALAKQMLEDKGRPLSDEDIVLPGSVVEIIRSGLVERGDHLGNEIGRCFGIEEPGALIRKETRGAAHIVFRKHTADDFAPIDHSIDDQCTCKRVQYNNSRWYPDAVRSRERRSPHRVFAPHGDGHDRARRWRRRTFESSRLAAIRGLNRSRRPTDRRSVAPAGVLPPRG